MLKLTGRVLFVDVAIYTFLLGQGLLVLTRHAIALVVHDAICVSLLRAIALCSAFVVKSLHLIGLRCCLLLNRNVRHALRLVKLFLQIERLHVLASVVSPQHDSSRLLLRQLLVQSLVISPSCLRQVILAVHAALVPLVNLLNGFPN